MRSVLELQVQVLIRVTWPGNRELARPGNHGDARRPRRRRRALAVPGRRPAPPPAAAAGRFRASGCGPTKIMYPGHRWREHERPSLARLPPGSHDGPGGPVRCRATVPAPGRQPSEARAFPASRAPRRLSTVTAVSRTSYRRRPGGRPGLAARPHAARRSGWAAAALRWIWTDLNFPANPALVVSSSIFRLEHNSIDLLYLIVRFQQVVRTDSS